MNTCQSTSSATRSPRSPIPTRRAILGAPGRGRGDRQRAGRAVPDQRAGGLQAPQGARARRADHPRPRARSCGRRGSRARALRDAAEWLEAYRRFWEAGFDRLEAAPEPGDRGLRPTEPGIDDHARLRRAARARVAGVDRARALRGLVRRRRGRRAAVHGVDGRAARAAPGGRRCSPAPSRREIRWTASTARWSRPSGSCSRSPTSPTSDALRAGHRRAHGPRRRPHRDALPAARRQLPPEQYEAADQGWGGFFDRMAERLASG